MRIGIDIGGTFTDIVCLEEDGTLTTKKVSSSVDDYSRSIAESLPEILETRQLGGDSVREVLHATTVATNALLEQSGANTALITTRGFRDVLELRRIRMPELYNWQWDKPPDLVERRLRKEVKERIDARGNVLVPLDREEVSRVVDGIAASGVESIAVCLINSYVNPAHEELIGEVIRQRYPNISVSISSEILREVKEYERTATTVVNAYVRPLVEGYLASLAASLAGLEVKAPLLIMQSNGGIMTAEASCRRPVFMIESGPAAGVVASHELAQREGMSNAITLDMGGTTTKASIIEEGAFSTASEYEVGSGVSLISRLIKGGGHLIRIPVIDVAEVGAGGGSIAWLDAGKALHVGPRSAGASPGPVCYEQGGTEVTITDANLILGYINPKGLVGGGLKLNRQKAEEAILQQLGTALELDLLEAAYGIHLIANSSMMRAVRAVSTERGRDLRDFLLIGFGGAGPIHACELARALEMKEVVIPPHPGLFSAFGLLSADIEHYQVQTYYQKTRQVDLVALNVTLQEMEEETRQILLSQGFSPQQIQIHRHTDLRYAGQGSELTLPLPEGDFTSDSIAALEQAFDEEHEKTYGHRASQEEDHLLVNLRVIGRITRGRSMASRSGNGATAKRESRGAYFGSEYGLLETPVLSRDDLTDRPQEGPLLIDEYDSTTVVPPDCQAWLDSSGNIRVGLEV